MIKILVSAEPSPTFTSAENVENSYTLANPPKLENEGWNTHVEEASKRALKEIMLQLYNIDITQEGVFEASMVDDIYQALYPELTEYTTLSGPMRIYEDLIKPSDEVTLEIKYVSGEIKKIKTLCRIDTKNELEYYKNGGILQYVLRNMFQ